MLCNKIGVLLCEAQWNYVSIPDLICTYFLNDVFSLFVVNKQMETEHTMPAVCIEITKNGMSAR